MLPFALQRSCKPPLLLAFCVAAAISTPADAAPTFLSIDNRLPNPDRPYDMTSGPVHFPSGPFFSLYDLQFEARFPQQLDIPKPNEQGDWEFDSTFDISYQATVSFGLGPVHQVTGHGTAHAIGAAPGGTQIFDSEIVSLDLFHLSSSTQFKFRESPTLESSGITTRQDTCPACLRPFTEWRISSFFDVFAEVSFDGGATWTPGDTAIHLQQPADPQKPLPDFNGDGVVDGADYIVLRRGMGTTYSAADFDHWRAHYGESVSSGAGQAAVPEPATGWLVATSTFVSLFLLRRQSRVPRC
jgi:hypothetical protein